MLGAILVSVFIIIAMVGFLLLSVYRAWRFKRLPVHSRLEIYPIPKEGAERAKYGGSYLEEPEWWHKPRRIDKLNELLDMLQEMIFIRKLFEKQRSLWWASYCFHLGVYAMFVWTIALIVNVAASPPWLYWITVAVGAAGFALTTLGSFLLLVRRIVDPSMRKYTTPQEYFNLVLIFCVLVTGIASWSGFASPFVVAASVLGGGGQTFAAVVYLHLVLLGLMLIYIPMSKMSHYVGKYFAFHKVLWDNDPNLADSEVRRKIKELEAHKPKTVWVAPHVNPVKPVEEPKQ
ncbi:MAG: respiratory nitrate reductase subunit gamma [Actinomycetia bacterium]|nr:respiratory nitrate reductase subunit gamma [Actinomycetes bacterium]